MSKEIIIEEIIQHIPLITKNILKIIKKERNTIVTLFFWRQKSKKIFISLLSYLFHQ
jgi:hypothetical protein